MVESEIYVTIIFPELHRGVGGGVSGGCKGEILNLFFVVCKPIT